MEDGPKPLERRSSFGRRGSFRGLPSLYEKQQSLLKKHPRVWELMSSYLSPEVPDIEQFIVNHIEYTLARSRFNFDDYATYQATAFSLRDRMIEFWNDTQQYFTKKEVKRVYYLSIEYLLGRSMQNSIINLGLDEKYGEALMNLGYRLEDLYEQEVDAALGNGGLGRLAACFLDSLATLNYPAWGYGIRYRYGMLHQDIRNGWQVEKPDFWLSKGNPWEICRNDVTYPIRFGGHVSCVIDSSGHPKYLWEGGDIVIALAYDTPIPGYGTQNTLNLRLWASIPNCEFDLESFNDEDYYGALKARQHSEQITSVLYPNDKTQKGKELRLKQQYFFCSASLRDILRRVKKLGRPLFAFPQFAAIQLNDTHPVIAIPELMRILIDEEGLGWDESWEIVTSTFAYTNHTVLPEALETWSVDLFEGLLPRHLQIIYEINHRFLNDVKAKWPNDEERIRSMSLIEEGEPKKVRMAYLAIVGSHSVNGVAAIHSEILTASTFRNFYELWPNKFNNKTNGVTPRRWLLASNSRLAQLITTALGNKNWTTNLDELKALKKLATDEDFQEKFFAVKKENKERLRQTILKITNGEVDANTDALFDVHVKRIHEYKRQLLNILSVIARYLWIKDLSPEERKQVVPRVVIFAGKAAPGYFMAKLIIKLINSVADVVNRDASISGLLKVIFLPNYNVSLAEVIIPASDISQHISTAGTEASGTSNMKFAMNGGLLLGTLDGANIEICEEVGRENMFIFGATADQVESFRSQKEPIDERLYEVLTAIQNGMFGHAETFKPITDNLIKGNDYYLVCRDFPSYLNTQEEVDQTYQNRKEWVKRCILCTAGMGKFSSDNTIRNYAEEIWDIKPCKLPENAEEIVFHK